MKYSRQIKTVWLKATLIVVCLYTTSAIAQHAEENQKVKAEEYCAMIKDDGRLVVLSEGKEMMTGVRLGNGTIIKSDGTVIKNDGTQMLLKNGECLDTRGNMIKSKSNKTYSEKEIMPPVQK